MTVCILSHHILDNCCAHWWLDSWETLCRQSKRQNLLGQYLKSLSGKDSTSTYSHPIYRKLSTAKATLTPPPPQPQDLQSLDYHFKD
jgi:hypothetical protein